MSWHILLFICFVILGLFLGILFFSRPKGDRFSNNILGIYVTLFSLELLYNCLSWSGYMPKKGLIHFSFIHVPLWLMYGPLVYIYTRRVRMNVKLTKKDFLFLIPVLLLIVLIVPYYILESNEKIDVWKNGRFYDYAWLIPQFIWVIICVMLFYGLLTLLRFGPSSHTGFRENKWLFWFVGGYFGYVIAFFSFFALISLGILDPSFDYFVDLIIVGFISILAFFGFVQPDVFDGKKVRELLPFVKYKKTGLSELVALDLKEKLENIMREKKPHLDNLLRLDDIAKLLNHSRNHTSQIINQYFNLSFFDFINKYRIEEAKRLLLEKNQGDTSITQIAYDAGFNNRASFYKAFKKFEGQTPTQYLNQSKAG